MISCNHLALFVIMPSFLKVALFKMKTRSCTILISKNILYYIHILWHFDRGEKILHRTCSPARDIFVLANMIIMRS